MNVIVTQIGSRHRYLIPQILEKNNCLVAFYTDSTIYSRIGICASFFVKFVKSIGLLNRLCCRKPLIPKYKIFTSDILLLKKLCLSMKSKFVNVLPFERWSLHYTGLESRYIKWGVKNADIVYGMYFENYEFLKYAKSKGLKVAVDIYESPIAFEILMNEIGSNSEYKDFAYQIQNYKNASLIREMYVDKLLALADVYTVPSEFVVKSLSKYSNFDVKKVRLLPYATSISVNDYVYHPVKHRIIWVGNDPIRKGLLYCAKAATKLKKVYPDLDFRIIGKVDAAFFNNPVFCDLNFVGVLNKEELLVEYRSAEAYVFPTLFEGFAGTIIEAASCGCPIITTIASGASENEFPAIFISMRNVDSIVNAVTRIFENQELRDRLSYEAYCYSSKLTPEVYEESLINILSTI